MIAQKRIVDRRVGTDLVVVSTAYALAREIAGVAELAHYPMRASLRDPYSVCDIP